MGREINQRKAAIIGCGFVGSATAFTLMQSQLFSELVLVDVDFDKKVPCPMWELQRILTGSRRSSMWTT